MKYLMMAAVTAALLAGNSQHALSQGASVADAATTLGSLAGLLYVCQKDESGMAKLEKFVAITPPIFRDAAREHAEMGLKKGASEVALFIDGKWIKLKCDNPELKKTLRSHFDEQMKSFGVQ